MNEGYEHITGALKAAVNNPMFQLSSVGKFVVYIAQAVLLLPFSTLQPVIQEIATQLFQCAGNKAAVSPQEREQLWARFHLFAIEDRLIEIWKQLFNDIAMQRNAEAEMIFIQNILKNWFHFLLRDRNNTDFPAVREEANTDPITQNEQSVIRYVAGFIAFKLKRFYSKFPNNRSAQHIVSILHEWRVTNGGSTANFLSYSTKWINLVDRGGLFHVNDAVFCFFRQLEGKARPYINKSYIDQNHNVDLKTLLRSVLLNSAPIRTAWTGITKDFDERELLFAKVIDIFINIRIRAYVKAVCYMNREKVSKKREKALRKDIVSG